MLHFMLIRSLKISDFRHKKQSPRNLDKNVKQPPNTWTCRCLFTMRTSSHRLAAVRKREAMLLASVNCSNLCLNLGSYLPMERIASLYCRLCYIHINHPPDGSFSIFQPDWLSFNKGTYEQIIGRKQGEFIKWLNLRNFSFYHRHNVILVTETAIQFTSYLFI